MNRDDIHKLIGGYATGTLTEAERKALFEAALHDQTLFGALADEEILRQLLADPAAKAELLQSLEPAPKSNPFFAWVRRPIGWAAIGSLAAAIALLVVMLRPEARHTEPHFAELRDELRGPRSEPESLTAPQPETAESSQAPRDRASDVANELRRVRPRASEPASVPPPQPPPVAQRQAAADTAASSTPKEAQSAAPKRETPLPAVINLPPVQPMSAVMTFQQTAPPVSPDAAELRAEKARSGLSVRSVRQVAAVPAPGAVLGVRYELQQRSDSGMYQRVDPDLPLRRSDSLRLEVETNRAGYLYAFETGLEGGHQQLSIGPIVDPHVKHTAELGDPSAGRKLVLVFSVQPEPAFSIGAATEGAARELERLRAESAAQASARQKSANSVYVVSPPGASLLLIEISLPTV